MSLKMLRNKLQSMKISLLLRSSSGSLLSSLFKSWFSLGAGVKVEAGVVIANNLNGTSLSEILDNSTSNRAIYLVLVGKSATGDAQDLGDFLCHLGPSLLVKEHFVVKLILYLYLGPGLFLRFRSFLCGVSLLTRVLAFSNLLCLNSLVSMRFMME